MIPYAVEACILLCEVEANLGSLRKFLLEFRSDGTFIAKLFVVEQFDHDLLGGGCLPGTSHRSIFGSYSSLFVKTGFLVASPLYPVIKATGATPCMGVVGILRVIPRIGSHRSYISID